MSASPPNVVATFNFGKLWYAELTIPFMRRYAASVGADFVEFTHFPRATCYPPSAAWFHVEAILMFASQSYHQNLMLLDADQLVLPTCPNLFSGLQDRCHVVRDMGYPTVEDGFTAWCARHFQETPRCSEYFNAGMLLLPLGVARRLAPLLAGPYPAPDEPDRDHWGDQHFLNLRIASREELAWLPVEFNWLAPQFTEAALQKHIVHFVGGHKSLLPTVIHQLKVP